MEKQFRKHLIASLFANIAQLRTIKWRKRKQPLRPIPRNEIPIGNPTYSTHLRFGVTYTHSFGTDKHT